jgi:Helix-turn-helix domain of transposase family ISL3
MASRQTFTEAAAAVLPRCRVTERLREHAAGLVADGGRTVAQAARECGLSWPVVHAAFAARADPVLEQPPSLVAHLGIDEHRRGRPRWLTDEGTGEQVLERGVPQLVECPAGAVRVEGGDPADRILFTYCLPTPAYPRTVDYRQSLGERCRRSVIIRRLSTASSRNASEAPQGIPLWCMKGSA